jgi:hypothetical protein
MAIASEVQSLNDIQYKSKIKIIFLVLIGFFLFSMAFLNFYPVGSKLKGVIKTALPKSCSPDFDDFHFEWLLPKIVITNLSVPSSCFPGALTGTDALNFNFVNINWRVISFAPFGMPFLIETEFMTQPFEVYYVFGINEQLLRVKDQTVNLTKIKPLLGNRNFSGSVAVDLSVTTSNKLISAISLKAKSNNLEIPPQTLMDGLFTTPPLNLKTFFVDAQSTNPPRVAIKELVIGNLEADVRAKFQGKVDLQEGNLMLSPMDISGEFALSEELLKKIPVDQLLQSLTQKDGFYQIRLGGTLGQPRQM